MGVGSLKCENNLKMNKTQEMLTYPKDNSLFGLKMWKRGSTSMTDTKTNVRL